MKRIAPSPFIFAIIAFIVGLNLRPILASIGPLFTVLQREAGLSATAFSLLTTLPVAMMGVAALSGPWLLANVGAVRGIMAALVILLLACLVRGFTATLTGLMITALAGGTSIGIVQALMPALIKKAYATSASTFMSLFSTGIMAGAGRAAAPARAPSFRVWVEPTSGCARAFALLALVLSRGLV
ncbi:MFS transporter, partial [Cronobacter malonaticus]